MNDAIKLALAREIYPDSKRAGRSSFSASQWAGVERAWEWIGKNYQPKDESVFLNEYQARLEMQLGMKQDDRVWQGPTSMTMEPPMKQETCTTCGATDPNAQGFCSNAFHAPPPTWTAEQREAALTTERDAALARVAEVEKERDQWKREAVGDSHVCSHDGGFDDGWAKGVVRGHADAAATIATLTKERDEAMGKARSVTREELGTLIMAYRPGSETYSDSMRNALRAVGIEVVG